MYSTLLGKAFVTSGYQTPSTHVTDIPGSSSFRTGEATDSCSTLLPPTSKQMAKDSKIKEFPDISNKLTAPTKKSLFERQKAEAEAKRQREQEETAAVYEDFVKSFDDEDTGPPSSTGFSRGGGLGNSGAPGGFSKRHFSGPPPGPAGRGGFNSSRGNSGPGSLGPLPPSLSRKRARDSQPTQREGLFAFEDSSSGPADPKTALQHSDDDDANDHSKSQERVVPKPTLRLSFLPPGTSPAAIKAVIPSTLNVDGVRILPPAGPGTTERRSGSAVVTLAKDTPALDIDTAVSALQNRYMGRGYYLTLSRHLSSASVGLDSASLGLSSSSSSLPFGARSIPPPNLSRAPSTGVHRGGYAPPSSYDSTPSQYGRGAPQVQVNVTPPADLKQLRLIHQTLEALLTHGPEFEALLMSRKELQADGRWAWLWDSRSIGGVYYRWRLWDVLTGVSRRRGRNFGSASQHVFEGGAAWTMPQDKLQFEYTTRLSEFVSDSDYDSSEDDDSGDEGRRRYAHHHGGAPPPDGPSLDIDSQAYLNPLQKAKLTHLLARLPTTNAKLRRGDVARVTAFAIQHAGEGAEEVVQMIVSNVTKPFTFTSANPDYTPPSVAQEGTGEIKDPATLEDTTPASLIALYLISDILSSSSTSGVRHAWRYRQLFETALKHQGTFAHLGRLEKIHSWGRLRAEKWKRSIISVLGLWEGWCVFPQANQEAFVSVFNEPPSTREEAEMAKAAEDKEKEEKAKGKWRSVQDRAVERAEANAGEKMEVDEDVDGAPMADSDAEDIDGEPLDDEDIDGAPMADSPFPVPEGEVEEPPDMAKEETPPQPEPSRREALAASIAARLAKTAAPAAQTEVAPGATGAAPANVSRKRQRPRAEDMFADSDGE